MTNMEQLWQAAWSWIVVNSSVERVSLVISLLAFSVAIRGVRHARRSARAAEIQARAAEIQAKAAEEQVDAAKEQVIAAREQIWSSRVTKSERIAEISALIEYRGLLESSLPKIVIGLESAEYPPLWDKCEWGGRGERRSKYPSLDSRRNFIIYNTSENEHDELSFLIRGVMINVG
ncbi:hypothetical protein [Streptosporangium sp. NPDC002524]|uniref:hypothetical protein n=1 Tax=Streptosporangium sp. NPDC002524 TaxID=3154537 RepID=UPI003323C7DF